MPPPEGRHLTVAQSNSFPARGIVLRDAAAASWFRERGLDVVDGHSLYLAANELRAPGFRFARVWHSPVSLATTISAESARVFVQVEGDSLITSESLDGTLGPGGVAVLPAHAVFSIASSRNVGRYETSIDLGSLSHQLARHVRSGIVYSRVTSTYRDILIGAGNSALNSRTAPNDKGYAGFRSAITSLATAMLVEEVELRNPISAPRREELYFAARQAIIDNATNPDFSVSQLARSLGVGARRLQEVFAQSGTTPKQALTSERVRRAEDLMRHVDGASRLTREDIAGLSGFRDRDALSRALAARMTAMKAGHDER